MTTVLIVRKEQIRALNALVAGASWKGGALLVEQTSQGALSLKVTHQATGAVWRIDSRGRTHRLRSPHGSRDDRA